MQTNKLSLCGQTTGALKHCKTVSFKIVFVPILTYAHECRVMTERMLSQIQMSEMEILLRVHSVTVRDEVRSCAIYKKSLNVESSPRIRPHDQNAA